MSLRIIHTADWHLGQSFYDYDRSFEHQCFLDNLVNILADNQTDILLVSGDVFDSANPSAGAMRMYYKFLHDAVSKLPNLQIIIIAGNHDSPGKLEAPKDILKVFNVTVVGMVECDNERKIKYSKLIVPLKNKDGKRVGYCLAVPFIRQGDYPYQAEFSLTYEQSISALYKEVYNYAVSLKVDGEFIVAMGHMHTLGADSSKDDRSERVIMGGLEYVPVEAFNNKILYTALGHIHKAQRISPEANIYYAGSPLPMSFSERQYKHKVFLVTINDDHSVSTEPIILPVQVTLLRVPEKPLPVHEVLQLLNALPASLPDAPPAPYLEVSVSLSGPEPSLKSDIESALKGKYARLARITPYYPAKEAQSAEYKMAELEDIHPLDVFRRRYKEMFQEEIPEDLITLFNEVSEQANRKEMAL